MAWKSINSGSTNRILQFIENVDQQCRNDMHEGFITSERDYVSRLISHLTYPYGVLSGRTGLLTIDKKHLKWVCRINPPTLETLFGADAMIIIKYWDIRGYYSYKICLFEAKWPIDSKGRARQKIDYTDTAAKVSHYHTQLESQHNLSNDLIKFSLYINANKVGTLVTNQPDFKLNGATCAWTKDAYGFSIFAKKNIPSSDVRWVARDFDLFSAWMKRYGRTGFITLREITEQILSCKEGTPVRDLKGAFNNINMDTTTRNELYDFIDQSGILK